MAEVDVPDAAGAQVVRDLTGTTVGRFAIRARLGAGGMGEVYRAEDTKLKRTVALKRMAPRLQTDEHYRRRFLKEAERASRLTDQHIAGLYDILEENNEIFLVMEIVEGQTLRPRLGQPMSLDDFLPLALQCAEALAAAHDKGIVHRDIKPENIMLTPAGQVKILDFGVARWLPQPGAETATGTATGSLSGTPAYMAPEELLQKESDARADIFSLGVVFYEALTGVHPFSPDTFMATADRILHEPALPPSLVNPQVPAELDRIVITMLAKKPADRYASARDLHSALSRFRRAEVSTEALPARPARLTRRATLRLALVAALAVAAVLLWVLFGPKAPPGERIRVAVLPFSNQTGDLGLDKFRLTLTQILVLDLTGSPNLQVLPYERLFEISRGFASEGGDVSRAEAVQAVALYSNSRYVVLPTMFAAGRTLRLQAEFRDAQTGETVANRKAERPLSGTAEATFYAMLEDLSGEIQEYFKSVGRGEEYRSRPAGSRPKTVGVALHLTEGRNAFVQGDYAQALASFQRVIQEDPSFPLPYAWIGQIYGLLGYDDKAREASAKAAQLINPQTPVTDAYFIEANLAERNYEFSAAEEKYLELIRLYPDDPVWQERLGAVYGRQGQYQKAISRYHEALLQDPNYVTAYSQLAGLYTQVSDFGRAIEYAQKSQDLYRALGNAQGEAHALLALGDAQRAKGDYEAARKQFEAAVAIFQRLGNEFGIMEAEKRLGDAYAETGKYREALRFYREALARSGEIQNNRIVAVALMNTGVVLRNQGNHVQAIEYFRRSLDVAERFRDDRRRAETLSNLGSLLITHGFNPAQGLAHVQEALSLFERMGNKSWEAYTRMLIGIYYTNTGHYQQGLDALRQSVAIAQAIEDKPQVATSTYHIGRAQFLQNDYGLARDSLRLALEVSQGLNDSYEVARIQILLGRIGSRLGEFDPARATLTAALRSAEQNQFGELLPQGYTALGELAYEQGKREEARQHFRPAAALWRGQSPEVASVEAKSYLCLLGAEGGDFRRALADCQASLQQADRMGHADLQARTRLHLARLYLGQRDYAAARRTLAEVPSPGELSLGPEVVAQSQYLQGQALEGSGKKEQARSAYLQAREIMRKLEQTIPESDRKNFAARRDIQPLLR